MEDSGENTTVVTPKDRDETDKISRTDRVGNGKLPKNDETADNLVIPPPEKIICKLVGSSLIVFDHKAGAYLYGGGKYFGKPIGIRKPKPDMFYDFPLELTFYEGYYLLKKGKITVEDIHTGKPLEPEELAARAETYIENFGDKYGIYEDLRDKGYIVRPGLKFGADFAVYRKGPGIDHSPYIICVLPKNAKMAAIDIVRAGRLANSVKKRFIIANALTRTYYGFKWYKP